MEGAAIKTKNTDVLESMTAGQVACWEWFLSSKQQGNPALGGSGVYLVYCERLPGCEKPEIRVVDKFETEQKAFKRCLKSDRRYLNWDYGLFVKVNEEDICEPLSQMLFAQSIIDYWRLESRDTPWLILRLSGLSLKELPPLPANLVNLMCVGNRLTTLPELPTYLKCIHCNNNALTILPKLPDRLETLIGYSNRLTELPNLPPSLKILDCAHNCIKQLPSLPNTLRDLRCSDNQLSALPDLPVSLRLVDCSNNKLRTIPDYNGYYLDCSNNPDLPVDCEEGSINYVFTFMADLRRAEAEVERVRCVSRCTAIKEELMADRCAPQRVERLLAQGLGLEEALEMLGLGAE
jgi:hypothetical protein